MHTENKIPYVEEWTRNFKNDFNIKSATALAIEGKFCGSKIRSIYWRIFLKILPEKKHEWLTIVERHRLEYNDLKRQLTTNPRDDKSNVDENNPLSLTEHCAWSQYFTDAKLKDEIKKDVDRTFPEIAFFQSEETRDIMLNVLFIYGKKNPHLQYKQGMHEILAPLLYVLNLDQETFLPLKKNGLLSSLSEDDLKLLTIINDSEYREHDVYQLFCGMMLPLQKWYIHNDKNNCKSNEEETSFIKGKCIPPSMDQNILFKDRSHEDLNKTELLTKIHYIMDNLVKEIDNPLYIHLNSLKIPPQVFGIRWLLLLFGREFTFPDVLYVWDVILSDEDPSTMIDFIYVGLLVQIRDVLIKGDYTICLQNLMRYPPTVDVQEFMKLALHIRSPKKYAVPSKLGKNNFLNITLSGHVHPSSKKSFFDMSEDNLGSRLSLNKTSNEDTFRKSSQFPRSRSNSESPNRKPSVILEDFTKMKADNEQAQLISDLKAHIVSLEKRMNVVEFEGHKAANKLMKVTEFVEKMSIEKAEDKDYIVQELNDISKRLAIVTINLEPTENIIGCEEYSPEKDVEIACEAMTPGESPGVKKARSSKRSEGAARLRQRSSTMFAEGLKR
uniref:Rab-GAP TBC domain-containing protein n=1 Tax=Rhabditophanes sp. KR3021 TaxID=114890 RepID=A0AC35TR07_9BILA